MSNFMTWADYVDEVFGHCQPVCRACGEQRESRSQFCSQASEE